MLYGRYPVAKDRWTMDCGSHSPEPPGPRCAAPPLSGRRALGCWRLRRGSRQHRRASFLAWVRVRGLRRLTIGGDDRARGQPQHGYRRQPRREALPPP
eukprot:6212985-Prymnesium_polylepis.1